MTHAPEIAMDQTRKDFHHPFQPYDIQQQFMEAVYDCIENSKVGIFESPTGTGKSLSLICGSLTWLREHKGKAFDQALQNVQVDDDEPEWMLTHAQDARRKEALQMRANFEARLAKVRAKEQKVRERHTNGEPFRKRVKHADDVRDGERLDEDAFMLDDYDSDKETNASKSGTDTYSADATKLFEKLGMVKPAESDRTLDDQQDDLKIFFCSRTHSQLSQFVGELQRVRLPPSVPPESADSFDQDVREPVEELKQLSLGSRKNLCINARVFKLGSQTAINERCLELQQPKTPAEQKCQYLPSKDSADLVLDFRDHALAKVRDIEDLAMVGKKLGVCPYYASRPAIASAEIVTLPYPLLLQKSAREALGISVKGHVVIIDEAHNLMDAVEGIYSTPITELQLRLSRESLVVYLQKFRNRLKGGNRVYVTQVVRIIDSLLLTIESFRSRDGSSGTLEPGSLLTGKNVDQINLSKLVRYINESKLARKVEGYISHIKQADEKAQKTPSGEAGGLMDIPTLTHVQGFLTTLMNPSKEGRFFWLKDNGNVSIRYLLLDPSEHFRDIAEDARAVLLAGGTMSPMDEYMQQLFPYLKTVDTLSCGHIIPPSSLFVRAVATDGSGPLDFSFQSRSRKDTVQRLGDALLRILSTVKGGMVVFFPSYGYLETVSQQWSQDSTMTRIAKYKRVFNDSPSASADEIFSRYSEAVRSDPQGAVLFSVVAGKLSEGINFSDELGRCVVVVGLPYPNLETPEWKAKMQYIDDKAVARGERRGKASREHAENVCMRAINQAIGRAIRHKGDWASILLLDSRYTQPRIQSKLPGWIKASLPPSSVAISGVESVFKDLSAFFGQRTMVSS